jgi:sulfite exporter TauE/SafE
MELTPTIVGLPMAMTLGFAFGMGPCLISCLPYLGPVFLGADGGIRRSWRILLPLSLGRLTGYGALGAASGLAGLLAGDLVGSGVVRLVLGCAALFVGLALLLGARGSKTCPSTVAATQPLRRVLPAARGLMPGGLYLMGVGMALNPCAPLGIVLFSAAATASGVDGALLGAGFGIGAIAVPALVYGVAVAYFGQQLRAQLGDWRRGIERLAAALLIMSGLANLGTGLA